MTGITNRSLGIKYILVEASIAHDLELESGVWADAFKAETRNKNRRNFFIINKINLIGLNQRFFGAVFARLIICIKSIWSNRE
jgi:hypothetical protein